MYKTLKKLLTFLIPKKILFHYESFFRYIYYQFYRGTDYFCNICEKKLRAFVHNGSNKICPRCGSLSRNRRLWSLLNSGYLKEGISVLHFSPSRNVYRKLKKKNIHYIASDLSGDFISDAHYDITCIDSPDETYDLIICYHILEHVERDTKAMTELYRVLKKKGTCFIQTPFIEGKIHEDPTIKTEEERLIHFGQKDHVRVYSVDSLKERLGHTGFRVNIVSFKENMNNTNGFKNKETILICKKG